MTLAAGELNRRIEIQERLPDALDELGMPVVGDAAWTLHAFRWANIKGQSGMGVIRDSTEGADTTVNAYSFRIRYLRTVTPGMRVLFEGQVYDIKDVRHDLGRQDWTDLICQVGVSDG